MSKTQPKHPMQPLIRDDSKSRAVRFKPNKIVRYLLDNGGVDMNALFSLPFAQEDRVQFAQLIGYSLCGFHELNFVPDSAAMAASRAARRAGHKNAKGCRDAGCEIHCGVEEEPG